MTSLLAKGATLATICQSVAEIMEGEVLVLDEVGQTIGKGVADGYAHDQSIRGGAKHLAALLRRYKGDFTRAAAAYNAGIGAVARYGGVPPYRETLEYVDKVAALHILYRNALKLPPLNPPLRAAE